MPVVLVVSCMWAFLVVFFFQAEDGIRDLVRSRGLGDVYKRQDDDGVNARQGLCGTGIDGDDSGMRVRAAQHSGEPVSYTHLTLPTSDLV